MAAGIDIEISEPPVRVSQRALVLRFENVDILRKKFALAFANSIGELCIVLLKISRHAAEIPAAMFSLRCYEIDDQARHTLRTITVWSASAGRRNPDNNMHI